MRTIIYGAGAVGSVIGARLFQANRDVVLIARGAHHSAILRDGLRLQTPDAEVFLPIPVVAHPRDLDFREHDVVVLTMKSQDTESALRDLENAAGIRIAVVSCQNGVANERLIARRFGRAYAMLSWVPATFLTPGMVSGEGAPLSAILPVGCYPDGMDDVAEDIAREFNSSHMFSQPDPSVMALKYAKLLFNLGNGAQAITGEHDADDDGRRISSLMHAEAIACYDAAGIAYADAASYAALMSRSGTALVGTNARGGGSTWQSLMRGGSVEVDYLNGEIVALGKGLGIATPANRTVQRICSAMAAAGDKPGVFSSSDLLGMIEADRN